MPPLRSVVQQNGLRAVEIAQAQERRQKLGLLHTGFLQHEVG